MTLLFYRPQDRHGHYSNFSRHPVHFMGLKWPTSEHAFQAMKFWPQHPGLVDLVHQAGSPAKAAAIGRDRMHPLRSDWEDYPNDEIRGRVEYGDRTVAMPDGRDLDIPPEPLFQRTKDVFMYEIVWGKFDQHPKLKQALLATEGQALIEDALHDPYWGWGSSKNGHNKLGRILMLVRSSFQGGGYLPQALV